MAGTLGRGGWLGLAGPCQLSCPRRLPVSTKPVEDDVDVASERQRVLRGDADNDMVKIENLTKVGSGLWERRWGMGWGEVSSSGGGQARREPRPSLSGKALRPGVQVSEDWPDPGRGPPLPGRAPWRVLWAPWRQRSGEDQHLQDADR